MRISRSAPVAPVAALLIAALSAGSIASAGIVPQTLPAVADAFIRGGTVTEWKFGDLETSKSFLEVVFRSSDTGTTFQRKTYIRFDLNQLDYPVEAGATHSLKLTTAAQIAANPTPYQLRVYALNSGYTPPTGSILGADWDETELTWINAPGNDVDSKNMLLSSATTLLTSFTITSTTADPVEAGTDILVNLLNIENFLNDGALTLMVVSMTSGPGNTFLQFASKEHSTYAGPTLTVMTVVPEPSAALGLAGLAGLLATRRLRRR